MSRVSKISGTVCAAALIAALGCVEHQQPGDDGGAAIAPASFHGSAAPAGAEAEEAAVIARWSEIDLAKPGFAVKLDADGRLWVFREGSAEWAEFQKSGELAKHVTWVGSGPSGTSLKAPDAETAMAYLVQKPGFESITDPDGRIWIFAAGSKDLEAFRRDGELAKHVTRIGAGPRGVSLKAPDAETIDAYLIAQSGVETSLDADRRLWVFRGGSPEAEAARTGGLPEKHITLVGRGPMGLTVKAPDRETAEAYVRLMPKR
jgi:hypothetical protein